MVAVQMQKIELFSGTLPLAVADHGPHTGRTFLVLHGGAGPASVTGLVTALSTQARVIVPTHPGFAGEPRPDQFERIADLVLAYLALLERLDATSVTIIGNSAGGWIAAEMALRQPSRIVGVVLLNAVGIDTGSPQKVIVNPLSVPPSDRAALSFHDPRRFAFAPPTPEALVVMAENQKNLRVYTGELMYDPSLYARLAHLTVPVLVLWGTSDRIVDVEYGRRWVEAIPGARFEPITEAGHFPHIEQLERVLNLIETLPTK